MALDPVTIGKFLDGMVHVSAAGDRLSVLRHRSFMILHLGFGLLALCAFPVWLAPVQVVVLPITDRQQEFAHSVASRLDEEGLRVEVDSRKEKVNYKIREAQNQKIPYMLVVGDKEAQSGAVSVRHRFEGDLGPQALDEFISRVRYEIKNKNC